ncbi:MAG: hypothetical protein A2X41_05490 [Candidatus Margulisbacteria bacterium GWE2_39_32]|nr:MAG: hypothetical protein A2X41_05490 [Candidatus Margulisbacteria bacterium GWE2_39_32]
MRILFVNRVMGLWRGGGETFDLNTAKGLQKRNHEIEFITGCKKNGEVPFPVNEFKTHYIYTPYLSRLATKLPFKVKGLGKLWHLDNYWWGSEVFNYLKENDKFNYYDAIWILTLPHLNKKIKAHYDTPTIIRFPGPPDPVLLKVIKKLPFVIVNGDTYHYLKKENVNCINIPPSPNLVEIHNKLDIRKLMRAQHQIKDDELAVIYVGRLINMKNIAFLIKGVKQLIDSTKKVVKLMIVGDGEERHRLEKLVKQLHMEKNVIFTGFVDNKDIYKYYIASDIYALLSTYESFSIATLEAMYYGLPVIVSNVGWLKNLVENNVTGNLINLDDIDSLVYNLRKYVENENLRKNIGSNGERYVTDKFSWESNAVTIERIFMSQIPNSVVEETSRVL